MEYLSKYLREGMFINQLEEWQIKIVNEFREVGRGKTKLGLFQTLDDEYTKLSIEDEDISRWTNPT